MTKTIQLCFQVLGLVCAMIPAGAFAAEFPEALSCSLNKSYSLQIYVQRDERGIQSITADVVDFLNRDPGRAAELKRPGMNVIESGNVLIVTQDFGRSGYAFMRFEQVGEGKYRGIFDFNLFLAQVKPFAAGTLSDLDCYVIRGPFHPVAQP